MKPEIDLISGDFYSQSPGEAYAWMRAQAPVYFDDKNGVWGVAKHADVRMISRDPETFSNAGGIRPDAEPVPQMIDMDDPEHWRRRKIVNRGFTPRRVRAAEAKVRTACNGIIDSIADRGECDLVMDIAAWLPMIMIGDMLGVPPEDRADLLRWSDDLLSALDGGPDTVENATRAFGDYYSYIVPAIEQTRAAPPSDRLLSTLVHAVIDGDRLDDEELVFESLLILIGGDETTRHVITGGMYELLRDRSQLEKLRGHPELLDGAVEEMLRWVTPIKNMARTLTREVELRGENLQAGQKLLLLYESANRDEDVFDRPDRFDIERNPNDHVAFGFGTHFCLGNSLARLEIKVMVETLLDRMPDLGLAEADEPRMRKGNFITGYERIPVQWGEVLPAQAPS